MRKLRKPLTAKFISLQYYCIKSLWYKLILFTFIYYCFKLDFYIDNDMIHIADTKVAHRFGDFFIRKLLKFEELNRKLHHIKI